MGFGNGNDNDNDNNNKLMVMVVVVVMMGSFGFGVSSVVSEENGLVYWANSYYQTWGNHPMLLNQLSQLQLSLDSISGSGFESVSTYGSGSFDMRIKAPDNNSTGVITSFYLTSRSSRHDELSFHLSGSNGGPLYTLNTNMFLYGEGGKDQRFRLWFDPTKDYHSYRFLWNPHQLVFYVDDTPIRVFKKTPGVYYPSVQTMFIKGSITSQKGVTINPKQTPFTARFQASKIKGCATTFLDIERCSGPEFWWNREEFRALNLREQELYRNAKKTYLDYNYCSDRARYPQEPPECISYE